MNQVKKIFSGGLNADDGLYGVGKDQYINGVNIRFGSSKTGKFDRIESILGHEAISTNLPAGTNYALGSCADEAGNRIIWWVWNSNGNHQLMAYNKSTGAVNIILKQSNFAAGEVGLNLQEFSLVTGSAVAGGIVYFTDFTNPPRRVNIDRYIAANGASTPPNTYTDDMFTVIRKAPKYPPTTITKGTDTNYVNNFIKDQGFQFCTRFRFKDKEESVLGEWSPLIPSNLPTDTYNKIVVNQFYAVGNQTEVLTEDISEVDVIVRYGNIGKSFVAKTVSVTPSTTTITLNFYADEYGTPVDDAAANKPYDNVPELSKALEIAKNRLNLGNNIIGNNTPSSTSLAASFTTINNPPTGTRVLKSNSKRQLGIQFKDFAGRYIGGVVTNESLLFAIGANTYDATGYVGTTIPFKKSLIWTITNLYALTEIPINATHYEIVQTKETVHLTFQQGLSAGVSYIEQNADTQLYENPSKDYGTKQKYIRIDITWLTRVKMGYTFTPGDLIRLYWGKASINPVPPPSALYTQQYKDFTIVAFDGNNVYVNIEAIDTGYSNNNTANTLFYFEIWTPYIKQSSEPFYGNGQVYKITNAGTNTRQYSVTTGEILGDVFIQKRKSNKALTPIYAYGRGTRTDYPAGSNADYIMNGFSGVGPDQNIPFNKKDIDNGATPGYLTIAQLTTPAFPPFPSHISYKATFKNPLNADMDTSCQLVIPYKILTTGTIESYSIFFEVRKYNIGGASYQSIEGKVITENDASTGEVIIEMPKQKLEAGKYYEFHINGSRFPVLNSTLTVKMFDQKEGTIKFTSPTDESFYDSLTIEWYAETMNQSEINWAVWDRDLGKPNVITKLGRVTLPTQIVFSNTYIQDTQVNGLSSFNAGNETDLDSKIVAIQKLVFTSKVNNIGQVLLAIGTKQTASIYLGEVLVRSSDESNDSLALSTGYYGSINVLKGSYGTQNPESVWEYMGNVGWYDSINGGYVSYSENGLFAFSNFKFIRPANLFSLQYRSLSQAAIVALGSRPFVPGGIDPYNKEALFSIPRVLANAPRGNLQSYLSPTIPYPYDIYDGQSKTLSFKLGGEKWLSSQSYESESFCVLANELYAFKAGKPYRHNAGNVNTFFGVYNNSKVMCVLNDLPTEIKSFENIEIDSDRAPIFVQLMTEAPYTQESDIVANEFDVREGRYYANLWRDRLSPNTPGYADTKMNFGDKMRGEYMNVMLEYDVSNNINFILNFVALGFIRSLGQPEQKQNP